MNGDSCVGRHCKAVCPRASQYHDLSQSISFNMTMSFSTGFVRTVLTGKWGSRKTHGSCFFLNCVLYRQRRPGPRLVLGWVTVGTWVNHLSHPGQLSLATPPWVGAMSTSESWDVNRHTTRCTSPVSWSCSVNWCLAEGWGNGDWRRPMGLMA